MRSFLNRFIYAFSGIYRATTSDPSFRLALGGGAVIVGMTMYIFAPLAPVECAFLITSWFLILITELQNTSFERALDKLHPDRDRTIGSSKDMAAGAVVLALLLFCIAIATIICNHINFGFY